MAILEARAIRLLVELGLLVIALGGGRIPTVAVGGRLAAIHAMVDKDLARATLATAIGANVLVLATEAHVRSARAGDSEPGPLLDAMCPDPPLLLLEGRIVTLGRAA